MYVLSKNVGLGDADKQLPSVEAGGDINTKFLEAITAHRQILSKIHATRLSSTSETSSDVDISALEHRIRDWRSTWPGPKDDEASQTYAQLLSLQALCLLYRPVPNIIPRTSDQSKPSGKYAEEALRIYENSAICPHDLPSLAWRYQIAITHLYSIACLNQIGHGERTTQVERCRQVVVGFAIFSELEKLRIVFDNLAELVLSETLDKSDAANRLLGTLDLPLVSETESGERDGERAMRVFGEETSRTEPLWNHMI